MAIWHGELGRKNTGGKIQLARKKRKYELGRDATHTRIGEESTSIVRTKGGNKKIRLSAMSFVNVNDKETTKKVKILEVVTNPANPDLARRKVVTKGAIVKTEIGEARITSRPTQDGIANAVLLKK